MSGAKKSMIGGVVALLVPVGLFLVDHQTQALGILKALGIASEVAPAEPEALPEPKVEIDAIE